MHFSIQAHELAIEPEAARLRRPDAGAYVAFEGWVRDHHQGRGVRFLDYEAWPELAEKEGRRIVEEACARFELLDAACIHRVGTELVPGTRAIWVGVVAGHREAAFLGGRWILDAVKGRVPIWKREQYTDGTIAWVGGQWAR